MGQSLCCWWGFPRHASWVSAVHCPDARCVWLTGTRKAKRHKGAGLSFLPQSQHRRYTDNGGAPPLSLASDVGRDEKKPLKALDD